MDFSEVMKLELEKSKVQLEELKSKVKRNHISQKEYIIEKYGSKKKKTEDISDNDESIGERKRNIKELEIFSDDKKIENNNKNNLEEEKSSAPIVKKKLKITDIEIMKQLRERNEPIRLFDETDEERVLRLQHLKTNERDEFGSRNDTILAEDEAQQKYLEEMLKQSGQDEEQVLKEKEKKRKERDMISNLTKMEMESLIPHAGKNDYLSNQAFVLKFIQYVLLLWESDLDSLRNFGSQEIQTNYSKTQMEVLTTYSQTKTYLQPLMKKLEKKILDEDIAFFLSKIINCCLQREYIEADELYMKLAIGNAAWPIGVTMVGIHARTGREKIFSAKVAHVLNDEEQRKYIQALKRLVTFCAMKFPNVPSKMLHSIHISDVL